MKLGRGHAVDTADAQPGDLVMLGRGGTGMEYAAIFAGWANEQHNAYYTIEKCHINGGDAVGKMKRAVSSGDIGAIFRIADSQR